MTTDNYIEDNLKYLDNILKSLVNNASYYSLSFSELYKHLYNRDFESDDKFNAKNHLISISEDSKFFKDSISNNQKALGKKLVEACYFLSKSGYVLIDSEFNIKITFSGILKASYGFVQSHQKEQADDERLLQVEETAKTQGRWLIFLTALVALGTLVSAVYYVLLMICSN